MAKKGLQSFPVGGIWLDREGDDVVVRIEKADGLWYEAIREPAEGNFSHIIEPSGIAALTDAVAWLTDEPKG